jgi:hypothetical protein
VLSLAEKLVEMDIVSSDNALPLTLPLVLWLELYVL